jgi:deoxyribose-phosphate aldolase
MSASVDRTAVAKRVLPLVDLTSLGNDDQPADIERLCAGAVTSHGQVASVCVWPRFVSQAVEALAGTGVATCAVANFPDGADDAATAIADARAIVDAGGVEVDVVVPWRAYGAGATGAVERLVAAVRAVLDPPVVLKAILETGELEDPHVIAGAGREALAGGADFLKTSTGKTQRSATPEAAAVLLSVLGTGPGGPDGGLKVSGGVATVEQASLYMDLIDAAFGPERVSPTTARFGASSLLGDVLAALQR